MQMIHIVAMKENVFNLGVAHIVGTVNVQALDSQSHLSLFSSNRSKGSARFLKTAGVY